MIVRITVGADNRVTDFPELPGPGQFQRAGTGISESTGEDVMLRVFFPPIALFSPLATAPLFCGTRMLRSPSTSLVQAEVVGTV